jgi:predicted TIM-barrel fold metal-dependent hydrolase
MTMPSGIGVVDTLLGLPAAEDRRYWAQAMAPILKDEDSRGTMVHAAGYMFKQLPDVQRTPSVIDDTLREMDKYGIEFAMVPVSFADELSVQAVTKYADRFLGSYQVDPNTGMEGIRGLMRAREELGVVAAAFFPCGAVPQVPINDKKAYPLYAKCVELNLPVFVNAGVPGPRVPMAPQHVELLDEVMYDFPELKLVTRHGCEPWADLAVKLMLKWPGLYFSTSAFAPRYYPKAVIDYANSRGADKLIYAGYYPYGLSLERIFRELEALRLKDEVWPRFLRTNALSVLNLEGR